MAHSPKAKVMKLILFIVAALLVLGLIFGEGLHADFSGLGYGRIRLENFLRSRPGGLKRLPILTYHHLLRKGEMDAASSNNSIISEEEFAEQMKFLSDQGFKTIATGDLYGFLTDRKPLPAKTVMITFDDGYQSNYVYAYPILKQYGFRGTVFVISSMIQNSPQTFNSHKLTFLSWNEMKQSQDVFEFQSHTHSLHHLDKTGKSFLTTLPIDQIRDDLLQSKKVLSADGFAYPYGQFNLETVKLLKETGYKMAFTNFPYYVTAETDVYRIPRFLIHPGTSLEDFQRIVNGTYE